MDMVDVNGKKFKISISSDQIRERVKELGERISKDYAGKNPLLLCVLNGSFVFAADLYREISIPSEISFVKLASYQGVTSTGTISEVIGINEELANRHIIIVEDIVDTGYTMQHMLETLGTRSPASIRICSLLTKPEKLQVPIEVDYVAFKIPNLFVVGYGLDFDQQGRNLKDIYTIVD